jgi:hypothetical protein
LKRVLISILVLMMMVGVALAQASKDLRAPASSERDISLEPAQPAAQPAVQPVAPPVAGGLAVDLQLDQGIEGMYIPEQSLSLKISVSEDCYVTIIDVGTSGKANVLFPNKAHSPNNFIKKGQIYTIPENNTYTLKAKSPYGDEYILAIASRKNVDVVPYLGAVVLPTIMYVTPQGKQVSSKDISLEANPTAVPQETPLNIQAFQPFYATVSQAINVPVGPDFGTAICRVKIRPTH